PPRAPSVGLHPNAKWAENGLTVAGGNGNGSGINQLNHPQSLDVDDDQTIYIADTHNHRIVQWKSGATSGQIVAGGNGQGNGANQLNEPHDVIIDKTKDSLIICDRNNRRVVRWPRQRGTSGETILSNIDCQGLALDEDGFLFVVDSENNQVKRYRIGDTEGTVVAGGKGEGNGLDQLIKPTYIFVDRAHSVYVSDWGNDRVMKWEAGAKQGTIVAGGQGSGDGLDQLFFPHQVVVDQLGALLLPRIINGGIAGIVGVICVFPLDLVKTRMQNQSKMVGQPPLYKNIFDCAVKTFRSGGFRGMYSGSAVNILLITPEKAIKLVANDGFRYALKTKDGSLPMHRQILAGAGAGTCQIVVTTPMELLKIQRQMAKSKDSTLSPNARQLAIQLYREKGILGLYKGVGATFTRDVIFSMMYFPLFAYFNDKGKTPGNNQVPFYHSFGSGIVAGAISAFLATPFDVVKTRLQTLEYKHRYSGIIDCATKIMKEEGSSAFFKGSLLRVMVIAPLFGIAQMVYYLGIAEAMMGLKPLGSVS
ncbi:unnamed protein product, partial [Rotaria sp. Silwood1]